MADPPPAHHCKDCGLVFDSGKSLDVHLHYHKENLLSKWAQQGGEESNNNHVHHKKPANNRTPHPPPSAATPDSSDNRGGGGYYQPQTNYLPAQQTPDEPGFILGTGSSFPLITRTPTPNSSSSPSPHSNNSSYHRYHPYQHAPYPSPSPDHHRNGLVSSSSPQQCDKCGFICESAVQLIEHNALAHSNNHVIDHQHHNNMFQIKAEPSQAEILDLDSHKVHVYQPPQRPPQPNMEQDRSVSALMSWVNDTNKEQHRFHQQSGLASPDCYGGAVSTTTLTPPEPDPISRHRPPDNNSYHAYEQQQQQHLQQQQANNQQQISSSQLPPAPAQQQQQPQQQSTGGGKSKSGSGGSWKSNEARRPKTYNCSACNKWFTSSGHLKRHYNTTLHKNAVKSSGVPDPASMPISVHHHPQKEAPAAFNQPPTSPPEPPSPQPVDELPPQPPAPPPPPLQPIPPPPSSHHLNHLNHLNHFLPSPPNLMAGSSEVTGGLLLHTTPYHQELLSQQQHQLQQHSSSMQGEPPPTYHLAFSPHQPQPGSQLTTFTSPPPSQAATANPNFQPPHVSTIGQLVTTTSSISGNNLADIHMYLTDKTHRDDSADNIKPLPSFSQQFVNHFVSLPQVTSSQSNHVGGPTYHFDPSFGGPSVFDDNLFYTQQLQATLKAEADFVEEAGAEEQQQSVQSPVDEFPTSTQASPNAMFNHEVEHIVMKSDTKSNPSLYEMMLEEDAVVKSEETVSSTIESSPISETRVVRGKEEKIYRCEDCDKIFNKVCYLTQHNKSFHAGNKPYKCERCGKRFLGEDERQAHASKHAGDKPYKCEMCPKQFNHKTDLRRHMCLHTGDKPFACEQCGKGFIRKDHMLKHCETHKKRSSRTQPPGQASPQVQAKKQLKMKLGHDSKLTAQPNPPPLAAMQLVM